MRKQPGKSLAPLVLRLCLGVTFLWAGMGKIEGRMGVQGANAATLANMGVVELIQRAAPDPPPPTILTPDAPKPTPEPKIPTPESKPAPPTAPVVPALVGPQQLKAVHYPEPISVARVYGMALLLKNAAFPALTDRPTPPRALWPKALAGGKWPLIIAWSVAVAEIACGVGVLLGLVSRVASWGIVTIMLGAIWLTQVGPALQTGNTMLGLLPKYELYSVDSWTPLLWQLSLLSSALALALMGPGPIALDRRLFPPPPPPPPASGQTPRDGRPI